MFCASIVRHVALQLSQSESQLSVKTLGWVFQTHSLLLAAPEGLLRLLVHLL